MAEENRLTVTLSVDCYRKDLKKSLWKKRWDRYVVVEATASQAEIEGALAIIIVEFSEDVVLNTVASW